jgi:hypothetical protein
MGTGQMMLTVAAVFLLSTIILSMNRTYVNNTETVVTTKMNLISVAFATSRIQRAARLAFDERTAVPNDTNLIPMVDDSTKLSATLGYETGERVTGRRDTLFDDLDDYNNYLDSEFTQSGDMFYIFSRVKYAKPKDPFDTTTVTNNWAKRIEVRVWPRFSTGARVDTIRLVQVFSYWRWR